MTHPCRLLSAGMALLQRCFEGGRHCTVWVGLRRLPFTAGRLADGSLLCCRCAVQLPEGRPLRDAIDWELEEMKRARGRQ
jgi:hypothetical protein